MTYILNTLDQVFESYLALTLQSGLKLLRYERRGTANLINYYQIQLIYSIKSFF